MTTTSMRLGMLVALSLALSGCGGGKSTGRSKAVDSSAEGHVKTGCDRFYYGGREPVVTKASLAKNMSRLCYRSFALGYSPVSRTALWSAEMVDSTTVKFARKLERRDEFHPEEQLAPKRKTSLEDSPRAELADYRGSGYDRGHLAPSGDMPTRDAQQESFTLANMVPQAPRLNRGSWAELESDVRDQSFDVKQIYVVTGPVFNGRNVMVINERVMIPSHVWKAILIPNKGAAVYLASNTDYPVWKTMSVAQFTKFSGVNPFPALDPKFANANMAAGEEPGKKKRRGKSGGSGQSGTTSQPWNPRNCNAPWRPTQDPHFGHCHPITQDEAKFGLVPGTVGGGGDKKWSTGGGRSATGVQSGQSWSASPQDDRAARLKARNRDRIRDGDGR